MKYGARILLGRRRVPSRKTPATRRAATPNSGAPELQEAISVSDEKNGTPSALGVIAGRRNVCLLMRRKFNLSRCSGCAYEFRAILVLLQVCSQESRDG